MSIKDKLTSSIIQILGRDNRDSSKTRQRRMITMRRIVRDLFAMRIVPQNWHMLKTEDIQALVRLWQKNHLKNSTIMNYLVDLRYYLNRINHHPGNIDNKSLNLSKSRNHVKPAINEQMLLDAVSEPIAWLLLALQSRFGLTFLEAININPAIHIRDNELWITREISTNRKDRLVPVISEEQQAILLKLKNMTAGDSLFQQFGERHLRLAFKFALSSLQLPTNLNYRYLYVKTRFAQLCRETGKKEARAKVISETHINNTNPLWKNLYE